MSFGISGFNNPSKLGFNDKFSKRLGSNAFNINKDVKVSRSYRNSEVKFYNTDSLWSRWRRGYELYTLTQSLLGSFSEERGKRGDYRVYFSFQQYPGVFIPARLYTFPSTNRESGEQLVGMRDTDAFSFYDYGLPILAVRYLGKVVTATYSQTGTSLVVTKENHGLFIGDSVYLDVQSGSGVDATLSIISITQNTFTVTTSTSASTSGNVNYYLSTTFGDTRWSTIRVKIRYIPTDVSLLSGERLADRIIERDPGITSTYSRSGTTVSITCSAEHGLSTDNNVFIDVISGDVASGRYVIKVINTTQLELTTNPSGTTSGNLVLSRLLRGRVHDDYVGYTVEGVNTDTNEIIFQRKDSYGATTTNTVTKTVVPAHRGFIVGRYLTTELRWQCTCQDFSRRDSYDLYSELTKRRFPTTSIRSTKPGQVLQKDGTLSNERDNPGTFRDLGYVTVNNFYELPKYEDTSEFSVSNLMYYQLRWCKHIYAAMFALQHDEGNVTVNITGSYSQIGPNITVTSENHGLQVNTKLDITFTSGNAISGEYTVTSVPTSNTFVVIYPFSGTTGGYCSVTNLKKHDYIKSWLLEPNDKPIGEGLKKFEKSFSKEREKLAVTLESLRFIKQNTGWQGEKEIIGNRNLPQFIADFDPSLIGMTLTDDIKRDMDGNLSRKGKNTNLTNRLITLVNKLFNKTPTLLQDIQLGLINKPLDEYSKDFEAGLIDGGQYSGGIPIESESSISIINCDSYSPSTDQDTVVDSDRYINI